MRRLRAFIRGMIEWRQSFTTYYRDWRTAHAYDLGRDFRHAINFRRYEQ